MDGVVIERTRPRLVSRCGLRKDRNCVPRAALNERHPHRTCVPNATKYRKYINHNLVLDRIMRSACRAAAGVRRELVSDRRSACPVVVCHFPGRAKHVVPRVAWWRAPRRMPTGPRVRDARWDFVERERHPHTCTRGQRARATATRPRRPRPTRQGEPGMAGAHTTADARSPKHTAQQLTHTLTPTRQAAPAATTSTAATRRLLVTRRALHRPAT